MAKKQNPDQPIITAPDKVRRFKSNKIVQYLLDNGGIDMNQLARTRLFDNDDWTQFAQLIGYSVSGFGELSYVSDKRYARATAGEN